MKVLTAQEMKRVEALAIHEGASEEGFMRAAGIEIARIVETRYKGPVLLLTGKGNNGGDAYAAGLSLLQRGLEVKALHLFPEESCTPLCRKMCTEFQRAGGKVQFLHQEAPFRFPEEGVILDGLVGTAFVGKAEGLLEHVILEANRCRLPKVAIDIPSGLNATTGEVGSSAICAQETIYLEFPKSGFFLGSGWDHVGELVPARFGLETKYVEAAQAAFYLASEEKLISLLPPIRRSRHKYEAGYVLGVAGSYGMAGSAYLASMAALRGGAGIVRLFYTETLELDPAAAPWELVKERFDEKRILAECVRAKALFIGPGLGRESIVEKRALCLLRKIQIPTVLDADMLYFLAKHPRLKLPQHAMLTPHHGEMQRLVPSFEKDPLRTAQSYVDGKNVTLVLKGAPTFVFHPHSAPLVFVRGDPGMATAGVGDVLTGFLAALLALGLSPHAAATLGVHLHQLAGERAAIGRSSHGMIASDLLAYLWDTNHEAKRLRPSSKET